MTEERAPERLGAAPNDADRARIPFRLDPDAELRRDARGRPVWPIATRAELLALCAMAELHGAELEHVPDADACRPDGDGLVIALGSELAREAHLYAHLTGRRSATVSDLSGLRHLPKPDVVVVPWQRIDVSLLATLFPAGSEKLPGLICAHDAPSLRLQVLTRAAARALADLDLALAHALVEPDLPRGLIAENGRARAGGAASREEMLDVLAAGAGVLSITAHSDGIDAKLGPRTLCSFEPLPTDAEPGRPPHCRITGHCYRHDRDVEGARADGLLISPASIAARVLALDVCTGFLTAGTAVTANWGLMRSLLASPRIGAIVSSWYVSWFSSDRAFDLADRLLEGKPLGVAAAEHLSSPRMRATAERVCLFGDPDLRLPALLPPADEADADESRAIHVATRSEDTARRGLTARALADLTFARLLVTSATLAGEDRRRSAGTTHALDAWMRATCDGSNEGALDAIARRARLRTCAHFIRTSSWIVQAWRPLAESPQLQSHEVPCPACGRTSWAFRMEMRIAASPARRIVICPVCRLCEDAPEDWPAFGFDVGRGIVRLRAAERAPDWEACLVCEPPRRSLRKGWRWPRDDDGLPSLSFSPPGPWPTGPLEVAMVIMRGTALATYRRPVWNLAGGSPDPGDTP